MFTPKNLLFSLCLVLTFSAYAQTVKVKKDNARIKNDYADGFEVELQGTAEEAEAALSKLMKSLGKTKSADNYIVVNEPVVKGRNYTAPVYGTTKQLGNIISAWIGVQKSDWNEKDVESVSKELENLIHDFGVTFHREKIQKQIDESVRASQAVEKQQQRLTSQNRDLNTKVENNKKQKLQLEQSLENNRLQLENLTKLLEKNKKDQDSVALAGEQIKKMTEMHRERQRKVN